MLFDVWSKFVIYLLRKCRIILSIVFVFISLCLLRFTADTNWHWAVQPDYSDSGEDIPVLKGYESDQKCKFPLLDPFDSSILKFVKHPKPLVCRKVQPEFTYMIANTLYLNRSLAQKYDLKDLKMREFWRPIGSDMSLQYGAWLPLADTVYIERNGIELRGKYMNGKKKEQFLQLYSGVKPQDYKKPKISENHKQKLNVLIFGVDSISKSNFIRNLPLTYDVLMKKLGGWVFNGYSKVDDNTFPNMNALLTGHKVTIHESELDGDFQKDFVDSWPFVWKNFSENGYATMLSEEQPGIYTYKAKGFKKSPTHVYQRAYGLLLNNFFLYDKSSHFCFGNVPESMILLDTVKRFMDYNSDKPHFVFSFLWKLSHDLANKIEVVDSHFAKWFSSIIDEGLLKNTAVFVMSDHGNRFDEIRSTMIGRYEERMPFMFLHLPKWFRKENPHIIRPLSTNTWRLSCQFDVYETLVDIFKQNYGLPRTYLKNRGMSLFREIPKNRTCKDVQIPYHFCVCQIEQPVSIKSEMVEKAAIRVLKEINSILSNHTHLCETLEYDKTLHAQSYKANDDVMHNSRWDWDKFVVDNNVTGLVTYLRVTIQTKPDKGVFEALVQCTADDNSKNPTYTYHVRAGDMSRINAYGEAGLCIGTIARNLEKFCYCKERELRGN